MPMLPEMLAQRTRPRTLFLAGAVSGAVALIAAVGYPFAESREEDALAAVLVASLAVETAGSAGGFVLHEEARAVPDLQFVDGEGRQVSLDAFEGKSVLLNIWATWCGPCREEMPALDRLQVRLGGPDFQVVPLSVDREGLAKVKAFYEELGLESLGIWNDPTASAAYDLGAVGLPTTLLLDPAGRELGRLVGPAEWDSPEMVSLLQRHLQDK